MIQGGYLTHNETVDSIRLFSSEVMPRLVEYSRSASIGSSEQRLAPAG
jgi:hypothetical protein